MASARETATNESVATYGNETRDYQEGELAVWEAATDLDLPGTTTSYVLECYDDAASYDDYVTLDDATCDADYFRIIRPAGTIGEGDWQGHDGTPNNGFSFFNTVGAQRWIFNNAAEAYSQIQDIIAKNTCDSAAQAYCFVSTGNESVFVGCIAFDATNIGAGIIIGIYIASPVGKKIFAINCLAHNIAERGFMAGNDIGGRYFYDCTSTNNGSYGFYNIHISVPAIAKNCCSSSNGTDWADNGGGWTQTTCTAEGANPTYVNAGGDDFHLAVGDTVCRGNGTDLSGDGDYPFDDDIDGDTRSAWDIGFDEYEAVEVSAFIPQITIF